SSPSQAQSPELEQILRRHIHVVPGEHPTFTSRQSSTNGGFYAMRFHVNCMPADLTDGPMRAFVDRVPVYWANGYAEADEPNCLLLVTAEPGCEAQAIATGQGATAWAWGGAESPD